MRSRNRTIYVITILASLMIGLSYSQADRLANLLQTTQPGLYRVVKVDDGDTITVTSSGVEERVRLIGIDTPELHHPEKPVQCFAEAARQFTASLINFNDVRLEADPEDDNRDLYGRLLRYVYLPDGTLVNAEVIKQGYGFAYTSFPFIKKEPFLQYERIARLEMRGLWAGCQIEIDDNGNQQTNSSA